MSRRTIMVLGLLQAGVIVVGFLGTRLMLNVALEANAEIPGATLFAAKYGLCLLLVPILWALACVLADRSVNTPDMLAPWLIIAGAVVAAVVVGYFGYAIIAPWFAIVPNVAG